MQVKWDKLCKITKKKKRMSESTSDQKSGILFLLLPNVIYYFTIKFLSFTFVIPKNNKTVCGIFNNEPETILCPYLFSFTEHK